MFGKYQKLFEDCKFYILGEFSAFDKTDIVKLVQMTGATLLKREPKLDRIDDLIVQKADLPQHLDQEFDSSFSCTTFVLYEIAKVKEVRHKYLMTVRPGWLFACIDQFKILHPDDPRLKP